MVDVLDDKYKDLFVGSPYMYGDRCVPRVTEILSAMLHEEYLMNWAEKMGRFHRDRAEILESAADIGTLVHAACETFLKTRWISTFDMKYIDRDRNTVKKCRNAFNSFLNWIDNLNKNYFWKPVYVEHHLVTPCYGGTLDALLEIGGKLYLIDFKTSNQLSYKYILQLAAYRYALRLLYSIDVDGCIVLRLDKYRANSFPEEMMIDLSDPTMAQFMNECEIMFMDLVSAYYNRLYVERYYMSITGKKANGGYDI